MNAVLQGLVLALLLAWSLGFLLRRYLPRASVALLARWAGRRGWKHFSHWLQPAGEVAGCDSGCGQCQGCGEVVEKPVTVRQPSSLPPGSPGCH